MNNMKDRLATLTACAVIAIPVWLCASALTTADRVETLCYEMGDEAYSEIRSQLATPEHEPTDSEIAARWVEMQNE